MVTPYLELSEGLASNVAGGFSVTFPTWAVALFVVIVVWSLVWKLVGLWKSARKGSWIWFVVLAITNTLGILPILYVYVFSEIGKKKQTTRAPLKAKRKSVKKKRR